MWWVFGCFFSFSRLWECENGENVKMEVVCSSFPESFYEREGVRELKSEWSFLLFLFMLYCCCGNIFLALLVCLLSLFLFVVLVLVVSANVREAESFFFLCLFAFLLLLWVVVCDERGDGKEKYVCLSVHVPHTGLYFNYLSWYPLKSITNVR